MNPAPFRSSVHRMLAVRIAVTAVVVGVIIGTIAWLNGQSRVQDRALELARTQTQRFNDSAMDLLSAGSDLDEDGLQFAAEKFAADRGGINLQDGRFVLARVYALDGRQLVNLAATDYSKLDVVEQAMDQAEIQSLDAGEYRMVSVDLGGDPYVGVAVPLLDEGGKVVAQMLGAFAVSEEALARIREGVLRSVFYVLAIVMGTALVLYPIINGLLGRLARLAGNLLDANLETLQVLGSAIAKRDSDTDAHNYRVSVYSVALAEAIGLSRLQIQSLIKGALLHDVGKLGIRDHVLLKPGRLDEDEFRVMKTHVEHGLDITDRATWLRDAQPVVGGHHEKFDGSGYPTGLSGQDIPINARIFAIVDVFDALTSRRPYKEPMSYEETMEILQAGRGQHFDPVLLDAFQGIAPALYREYGGRDDQAPRQRLEVITQEYFMGDAGLLLG